MSDLTFASPVRAASRPERSTDDRMPSRITEILLDDRTWSEAPKRRRLEWRTALDDLLADHVLGGQAAQGDDELLLVVTADPQRVELDLRTADGRDFAQIVIATSDLQAHLREYLTICEQLGRLRDPRHSPHWEALDIGKRIAHDEAAETVQRICAPLGLDLQTARRLFTLLVTLHFDTTRLALPTHGH